MLQQEIAIEVPKRTSRDEMNLAEFPLTLLSTRSNPNVKTLEFNDIIRTRDGEVINREWVITGADKFGLPTASDDEVLIGLLKLTVDQGMEDRRVYFTRYELLKTLQWTTEGRSYQRLQKALDRLSGVRIKATNAFYDNSSKSYSTVNFGIIDAYEINDARDSAMRDAAPSFFLWSEVLYNSFQVGYIKKLDLSFYLALQSAISKRLYRYLDKHFWYKSQIRISVFTLAHEKLGISRNYKYLSSLKQQLDPAIEELIANGFLAGAEYLGNGKDAEIVLVAARGKPRSLDKGDKATLRLAVNNDDAQQSAGPDMRTKVALALEDRGLKPQQIDRLLRDRSDLMLEKTARIIEHFDKLCSGNSRLVSRSPVGFLYRAVEVPENFHLPGEEPKKYQADLFKTEAEEEKVQKPTTEELKAKYLVERKREAKRLRGTVEDKVLQKVRAEVEVALARFKDNISPENFKEAVEHGVEERLLNLFAFPSFEEWIDRI
ncbi:MAG: replication initiator protein A [Deltaproteobacteria bacterium]|nr:replication initiator protein A [Deltaproteobacteria bacterium]